MASVNFNRGKLKGGSHAKGIFRHCDEKERSKSSVQHENEELDKGKTHLNTDIKGLSYAELCRAYDNRIKELDENGNTNIRKDRVTCFSLNIPTPKDLQPEKEDAWYARVSDLLIEQYGAKNFLDLKIHRDEIHEYTHPETKELTKSRTHGHAFIVPEVEGQLNGKQFSSRANMKKINKAIQDMTEAEFGCHFMDGTKTKSSKTVEILKQESRRAELDGEIETKQAERDAIDNALRELRVQKQELIDKNCTALDSLTKTAADHENLKAEVAKLRNEEGSLKKGVEALEDKIKLSEGVLESKQAQSAALDGEIKAMQAERDAAAADRDDLKGQRENLSAEVTSLRNKKDSLDEGILALETKIEAANNELNEQNEKIKASGDELAGLEVNLKKSSDKLNETDDKVSGKKNELTALEDELAALNLIKEKFGLLPKYIGERQKIAERAVNLCKRLGENEVDAIFKKIEATAPTLPTPEFPIFRKKSQERG